ncbi:tRNA pseudouridine synthase 1 [Nowakowskiella sp. JEL0407]|nr:tRNA pseudouridine synthase 1 [Nowakowskiella sp. JEL0407]
MGANGSKRPREDDEQDESEVKRHREEVTSEDRQILSATSPVSEQQTPEETTNDGEKEKSDISKSTKKNKRKKKELPPHIAQRQAAWNIPKSERKPEAEKEDRRPKKKVALLIGYCGTGYQGMQMNPKAKTIESDLYKALAAANAVSKDNADDPHKVQFMRAARTDKGVHAAGQICSLKMIVEDEKIVEKINEKLPDQIRVWGYARVPKGFHAKNQCDSRVYEYLLPTYTLLTTTRPELYPHSPRGRAYTFANADKASDFDSDEEDKDLPPPTGGKSGPSGGKTGPIGGKIGPGGSTLDTKKNFNVVEYPPLSQQEMAALRRTRITPERLALLKNYLKEYLGTHNYHNFTIGKKANDKSAWRYIIDWTVGQPFVKSKTEWISLKVTGQSFMLHQIRKMVGLVILGMRTNCPPAIISKAAFSTLKINIPKAPGLGLLLEQVVYKGYNEKQPRQKEEVREPILFSKYQKEIDEFKNKWIYEQIVTEEEQQNTFEGWLRVVDGHAPEYSWWLTHDGNVIEDEKPDYDLWREIGYNKAKANANFQEVGDDDNEDGDSD